MGDIGYIYVIKNTVNNKEYIGKTEKTVSERWKEHLYNVDRRNQAIYLAMRKHGRENFHIEIIEEVFKEKLNDREIHWIKEKTTLSPSGYNMTRGGDFGNSNPMYDPEIVKKNSAHKIGDKNSSKRPEVRQKIREKALGRKISDEAKKKMSENNGRHWAGKTLSPETRKKISENHGCRGKFGSLNPNSKSVCQIHIETNEIIHTFGSIKEAETWVRSHIRISASGTNIIQCCRGYQKTAFGFKWEYADKV